MPETVKKDKFITIPKKEFERMEATIETLKDKEVLEGIKNSRKEIREGKTSSLKDVKQELPEK